MKTNLSNKLNCLLIVFSPWLLLLIVVYLIENKSIIDSVPLWSDEIIYWHEIFSFSTKGFNFGYYGFNEILPKFLSFGTHGFGTIFSYAIYAKIFGWGYNSIVLANNLFISCTFLIFIWLIKLSSKKILQFSLFYLSYIPLILYCSTSMSELLNYAVLLLYFLFLYLYIDTDINKKKYFWILFIFTIYICFIRIIYIALIIPVLLSRMSSLKLSMKLFLYVMAGVLLSYIVYWINLEFTSPYPYSFLYKLFAGSNILEVCIALIKHFLHNIINFINPFRDNLLQVIQRYFYLIIIAWCFFKSKIYQTRFQSSDFHYFISFLILVSVLFITLVGYDVFDYRDYRVLSPVLFGVIFFLTISKNDFTISLSIMINIVSLSIILFFSSNFTDFLNSQNGRYSKVRSCKIMKMIKYTNKVESKFENTLVIDNFDNNLLLNLPAGIGITYSDSISDKLMSKYIFSSSLRNLKTYKLIGLSKEGFLYKK